MVDSPQFIGCIACSTSSREKYDKSSEWAIEWVSEWSNGKHVRRCLSAFAHMKVIQSLDNTLLHACGWISFKIDMHQAFFFFCIILWIFCAFNLIIFVFFFSIHINRSNCLFPSLLVCITVCFVFLLICRILLLNCILTQL